MTMQKPYQEDTVKSLLPHFSGVREWLENISAEEDYIHALQKWKKQI